MITLHFYLDTRAVSEGSPAPLKLVVAKRSTSAMMLTGISLPPSDWDAREQKVVNSPRRKVLNSALARLKVSAEDYLQPMLFEGKLAQLSAFKIRDLLQEFIYGTEKNRIRLPEVAALYSSKTASTNMTHRVAMKRCAALMGKEWDIPAEDVTPEWVAALMGKLMEGYSANTALITIARLHCAWNIAVERKLVTGDPFKGMTVKRTKTRSRDLSREQMRLFLTAPSLTDSEERAVAFFSLSFYLCAMNTVDLYKARRKDIFNGRILYTRSKTGKDYTVKVIEEAQAIIERYGTDSHLFDCSGYRTPGSLTAELTVRLHARSERLGIPHKVSMYWARHTFASIAYEIGTSIELVSAALGHSYGAAVTMGYVDVKQRQVDEVQRKVVDYVLGTQ